MYGTQVGRYVIIIALKFGRMGFVVHAADLMKREVQAAFPVARIASHRSLTFTHKLLIALLAKWETPC
jgi:hypothetical protein